MITITKRLDLADTYPLDRIGPLEDLLFFDIETTGFSGDTSNLYLIGCTYYQDGSWNLIQWFADTADSEPEVLDCFFEFLKGYRILIHFNGDGFDIPYLLKRCRRFKKPYDFSGVQSLDIYKKLRPYRKLLGLDSLKQKAVEQFLGVSRKDQYSGGQLIEVYKDYLVTRDQFLYDLLLLHNEDDLKGMPLILPALYYPDFFQHPFALKSQRILTETFPDGASRHLLELVCVNEYPIPQAFSCESGLIRCQASGGQLTFLIELYDGSLKQFYPNYQDYYYLIHEDRAVHKSVGGFLDRDVRTKATAKTCYTRHEGCFVPQFEPIWQPALKQERSDKLSYAALTDVCLRDPECLQSYIRQLFGQLGVRS